MQKYSQILINFPGYGSQKSSVKQIEKSICHSLSLADHFLHKVKNRFVTAFFGFSLSAYLTSESERYDTRKLSAFNVPCPEKWALSVYHTLKSEHFPCTKPWKVSAFQGTYICYAESKHFLGYGFMLHCNSSKEPIIISNKTIMF